MRHHQAILVSCEIPWDENERLLEPVFREEVRHTLAQGFHNLYIFGTAGEGYAVDTPTFQRIVEIFREETSGEGIPEGSHFSRGEPGRIAGREVSTARD